MPSPARISTERGSVDTRPDPVKRFGVVAFFAVWAAVTTAVGGWLMKSHGGAPEEPVVPIARAILEEATSIWYVLGSDCGLSDGPAAELLRRGPDRQHRERVWLVDAQPELATRLRAAGFSVTQARPPEMPSGLRVRGSPWLVLFDAAQHPAYSGRLGALPFSS